MYINDRVRLISSTLPSLTLSELESLREEIDSLLSNYGWNVKRNFILHSNNLHVFSHGVNAYKKTIPQSFKSEYHEVDLYSPISQSFIKIEQIPSTQNPPRPLGIWKGKVEVSEDFNNTSSDILSEFGIEE